MNKKDYICKGNSFSAPDEIVRRRTHLSFAVFGRADPATQRAENSRNRTELRRILSFDVSGRADPAPTEGGKQPIVGAGSARPKTTENIQKTTEKYPETTEIRPTHPNTFPIPNTTYLPLEKPVEKSAENPRKTVGKKDAPPPQPPDGFSHPVSIAFHRGSLPFSIPLPDKKINPPKIFHRMWKNPSLSYVILSVS